MLDTSYSDQTDTWHLNELWLACGSGFSQPPEQLHIVEVNSHGWQEHSTLNSDILKETVEGETNDDQTPKTVESKCITSMCLVNGNAVWIGDNAGFIHAYIVNDHNQTNLYANNEDEMSEIELNYQARGYPLLFSYKMEPDAMEEPSPVRAIHFVPELQRVCVAMHNGRMFLCDAGVIPHGVMGGEGSFVMTELGSLSCIHSVSSVLKTSTTQTSVQTGSEENQSSVEIWYLFCCKFQHVFIILYRNIR